MLLTKKYFNGTSGRMTCRTTQQQPPSPPSPFLDKKFGAVLNEHIYVLNCSSLSAEHVLSSEDKHIKSLVRAMIPTVFEFFKIRNSILIVVSALIYYITELKAYTKH